MTGRYRPLVILAGLWLSLQSLDLCAQTASMRLTLPGPTAASLGKFGDVPVSLYTGVPDISIPLFTAAGRTLQLPIALKYHAAGVRVEELGGWVGIGWALEAGGTITRSVRSLVDESLFGYYNTGHTFWSSGNWPNPPNSVIDDIVNENLDGEPDQFFFSFAGRSGQFVMGPTSSSPTVKEYRTIPYQKLRIEPTVGLTSWVITTEDGTRYTFTAMETNTDLNITSPGDQIPAHYGEGYTSAWHLTEARSIGGDVITLSYTPYTARHRLGSSYREKFDQVVTPGGGPACVPSQFDVTSEYEVQAQRLVSITSAAHTITFTPGSSLRSDALSPTGAQQEPRLDKVTIATPSGTVLRVFKLDHDYSTGRLTLKHVYEQDRNGISLPPYSFTYVSQTLPAISSFAQDHWGYFNGKSNTTSIPAGIAPNGVPLSGADRRPDAAYMPAAALTRITYPAGGYNEFVYEPNDYGAVGMAGAAVMDYGPPQWLAVRSFAYEGQQDTTFTVGGTEPVPATVTVDLEVACGNMPGCPYAQLSGEGFWTWPGTYEVSLAPGTYTATASEEMSGGFAMITVSWRELGVVKKKTAGALRVAELRTADAMGNVTTRKYKYTLQSDTAKSSGVINLEPDYDYEYSSPSCSYFSRSSKSKMPLGGGPPVGYSEVTVWHGATGQFGKSRHTFRSVLYAEDEPPPNSVWPFSTRTSREWKRGQQLGVTEYNASGQIQRRLASTYKFRDITPIDTATTRRFRALSINSFSGGIVGNAYVWNPYEVVSGWAYQDTDTTVVYNDAGSSSFATARTYVYGNSKHIQLTEQTETNSDGAQRITRMSYPADYATGSGNVEAAALTQMQGAAHMHSPVIERWIVQRTGSTDSVVQASLASFREYASGQYLPYQRLVLNSGNGLTTFVPSSVAGGAFTKDTRYLLQETADSYDSHGRITHLTDARGNATAYQYGGNPNSAFLTKVTQIWSGGPDLVTDIAYDTDGFVASIKDEGGTFRYFTYDLYGRLRQIKNHGGTVVKAYGYSYSRTSPSWTFNPSSPNAVVDTLFLQQSPTAKSVVSTQYVDGLGRSIQTVVQDGASYVVSAAQYDGMGRPWRSWKPYTRSTAGYDASFVTNATNFYNTYHSTATAKPYTETSYTTDALNRVKQLTPPYIGSSPTAFTLSAYGVDAAAKHQYTEITDESGKKGRSYVDAFGNAVKTILGYGSAEATTTLFVNNVLGERIQTTDPRSLTTSYAIDTRGLLISKVSPDAGTVSHKYDKGGNLRYAQDANQAAAGQVHFTTYDVFNRLVTSGQGAATFSSLDPDAGSPPALETTQSNWLVVLAHDAKPSTGAFPWSLFSTEIAPLTLSNTSGRLAAVASQSNGAWQTTLFSYDADGRIATRYTYMQANGSASILAAVSAAVTYVRDLRDAITERWLTVGSNTFNHWYDYDNRGLLWKAFASTGATKPGSPDATYTYRPSGQLQDRQFEGGPLVPLRYDIREQLEKIGDPAGTSYPFSARYAYHANGTVSEAEFYNAGSPAAAKRYRYQFPTYDALNRLKNADFSSWNGSSWTSTLAYDLAGINYDAAGNLTALQRYRETASLIDNLSYGYAGSSNRLSSVTDAVGGTAEAWDAETGSFTYDANGNVLTAPAPYSITALAYDDRNLPVSVTRSGTTTAYRYDDAGQRIAKQVGGGDTEVYVLDGAASLGVVTVNGSGNPTVWHFNVLAGDRVIGRQPNSGSRSYYHTDLLGSTRSVVEATTVVESYDFDPWGLLMPGRTLGNGTKEGFTGKEQDVETGLDYFGARYYMPALGRWTGVDPLAERHPEWTPYNYVLDDPLSLFDPDGRQARANGRGPTAPGGVFVRGPVRPGAFAGAAVRGLAMVVDRSVGVTPASVAQDATAVALGRTLNGDPVSAGDRWLALVGFATPLSGTELRAGNKGLDALLGGRKSLQGADTWGNAKKLDDHFERHGSDFGTAYKTADEYAQGASDFLKKSQAEGMPTKIAADGTIRVYDPKTNTFASYNPDGTTKTFFKPDPKTHGYKTNLDYWKAQPGGPPRIP